jgi:hypothetical protein
VPGEPLVEDLGHALHRVGRHRTRDLDEDRPDDSAPEVEHQQQPIGAHPHELEPLEDHGLKGGADGNTQLLGQNTEHLGGAVEDLVHRRT